MLKSFRSSHWLVQLSFFVWLSLLCSVSAQTPQPLDLIRSYLDEVKASKPRPEALKRLTTDDFKLLVHNEDAAAAIARFRNAGKITAATILETERYSDFSTYLVEVKCERESFIWQFRIESTSQMITLATLNAPPPIRHGRGKPAKGFAKSSGAPAVCSQVPRVCDVITPDKDPRLVEFLFATDRKRDSSASSLAFGSERNASEDGAPLLSYGGASVRIPEDHRIGRIELPSSWKLFGWQLSWAKEDERKHLIVKKVEALSQEDWSRLIEKQGSKTALIFVHGFNTSFTEAILRNAQIVWDLQYRGVSVLYSWSSKGSVADYLYDRDSALFARKGFLEVINRLRNDPNIEAINVLAHSMGNLVVVEALSASASSAKPVSIDQLVMASPDIARDAFIAAVPDLAKIAKGMTLYASGADRALKISGSLASFPRAGDVPTTGPVVLSQLDTIDVSLVGDELLGLNHTEFATNRAVMDDLSRLLNQQEKSPRLNQIRRYPEPPMAGTYWRYVP